MEAPQVALVAVVQVGTQPPGVLHQVILSPDKVKDGLLIRLGDFPGDEYTGWQFLRNVAVVQVLGKAVYDEEKKQWLCVSGEPAYVPVVTWTGGKDGNEPVRTETAV